MKKVLVVEDDLKMRKLVVDELKKNGFGVIEAENGQEGLDAALKNKPDLILLDLMMPIMNGLDMLKRLRETDAGWKSQVIILTNSGDFAKIAEAVEKGICSYLIKSDITTEDLVKRVKNCLENK